jgi:hypothetical protein
MVAWNDDVDMGIGATLGIELPELGPKLSVMADFLLFFPEVGNYWELSGDLACDVPVEGSSLSPFVMAGLSLGHASVDVLGVTASNSDLNLNVGGGLRLKAGRFRPEVGGRLVFGDGSSFTLFGTLPFALGS